MQKCAAVCQKQVKEFKGIQNKSNIQKCQFFSQKYAKVFEGVQQYSSMMSPSPL